MTRLRKALLGVGFVLLLLGGSAAVLPPLLWGDRVDYSQVASIEATPEYQDPALLARAWALPVASSYRAGLDYQRNPSFCGPTSVVNVMRSLQLSGDQHSVLDGTGRSTVFGLLPGGIQLDQLAELARLRLGKRVTVLRDLSLEQFRQELTHVNDPARRYTINFTRGPLFGRGGGQSLAHRWLPGGPGFGVRARRQPQVRPLARALRAAIPGNGHGRSRRTKETRPAPDRVTAFERSTPTSFSIGADANRSSNI
jgi:hypothetical protein